MNVGYISAPNPYVAEHMHDQAHTYNTRQGAHSQRLIRNTYTILYEGACSVSHEQDCSGSAYERRERGSCKAGLKKASASRLFKR
eukprot:2113616-Pleurochrysis_carterae.AAC.1